MSSRNLDASPRRYIRKNSGVVAGGTTYRRYSRSKSRSRERSREHGYRRRNTRSRSRERNYMTPQYRHGPSAEQDLYRDIINDDYKDERNYGNASRGYDNRGNRSNNREDDYYQNDDERQWRTEQRERNRDHEQRDYDRGERRERDYRHRHGSPGSGSGGAGGGGGGGNKQRYISDDSDDSVYDYGNKHQGPCNTIFVLGLEKHITEADIMGALIQVNMAPTSIRLIRKKKTGASRGFAFVEFNTVDEAAQWMELTQGTLQLQDHRANLQYSHTNAYPKMKAIATDWYCVKCGVNNFKRRFSCFKCSASRVESEKGGEGNDEISNILTKKIMLRNLDALTNEEGVLTVMQQLLPEFAKKITKILVSRDTLTQTSRGICYLSFDTLIDSMNVHNALSQLEPPLKIDNRDITITYCIDHENRQMTPRDSGAVIGDLSSSSAAAVASSVTVGTGVSSAVSNTNANYTLADVPRLAEYSATLYATTPAEHAHYLQYYNDYYVNEINKGEFANLPRNVPLTEANSGAAVALSAIQRQQKKMNNIETTATAAACAAAQAAAAAKATYAQTVVTPKGNDGKAYPTPDVTQYQYDESSGYYYDPLTGLYYDAHSQYYYNSETGAYLYWDHRKSNYVLATAASAQAAVQDVQDCNADAKYAEDDAKKDKAKDGNKHDKVKVAKKIVKDMEKWAKQLNQKKDYTVVATPQPILTTGKSDLDSASSSRAATGGTSGPLGGGGGSALSSGGAYADVCFSILEKKERAKLTDYMTPSPSAVSSVAVGSGGGLRGMSKIVNSYASDSEEEQSVSKNTATTAAPIIRASVQEPNEKNYVDFQKLTCLLCKRAFQSLDVLQKHLKMSNLHKENLTKLKAGISGSDELESAGLAANYRDRAKERRLKYGESDPPPPNRSRERFEHEIKTLQSRKTTEAPVQPIGSNNVGNRLLQKMGWSEGQGLGRKNQGRTQIIETEARSSTAGLGTKSGIAPGDDYKTYMKKMMKARYESA